MPKGWRIAQVGSLRVTYNTYIHAVYKGGSWATSLAATYVYIIMLIALIDNCSCKIPCAMYTMYI